MKKIYFKFLIFTSVIIYSCNTSQNSSKENNLKTDTSIDTKKTQNNNSENFKYYPDTILLNYMNRTFSQLSDTVKLSNKILGIENCGWRLNYKGGHFYEDSQCQEMGYTVRVNIDGTNKSDLIKLVNQNCFKSNYAWYNDSTEYRPEMYYERVWTFYIVKEKHNYILELNIS